MRIALLSYRSKPHCGGQGIYIRHLSRELVNLGHEVEVFSGQPYPELDEGVVLTEVPSLDLYREPDPFRTPRPSEFRDLDRRRGGPDDVDRRLPRAQDVQLAGGAAAQGPGRRLRRRPRQPGPRLRHARDREDGPPAPHHDPPPDQLRPPDRPRGRTDVPQEALAAPVVRLPAHAGQGRPPGPHDPHAVGHLGARHRHRLRRRPGPHADRAAGRRRRVRAADRRRGCRVASSPWPAPTRR